MIAYDILERLNAGSCADRLQALDAVLESTVFPPVDERMTNNHIHTSYSFSPYSPTAAVYAAKAEGLATAGIVDHDSMSGAREFIEAGKRIGIATTIGTELRVSLRGTPFADARLNNPDQIGVAYMALHAVPHHRIDRVQAFLAPLRERRNERNRRMVARINALYADQGVALDYARDVLPLSRYDEGGGVTERHLMLALARQLPAASEVESSPLERLLAEYDLVGTLKKDVIGRVYVDADAECPTLDEAVAMAADCNAILAYAYLGDVTTSVTGDKKAQKFEDDRLDELFMLLHAHGVRAITYMPTRNTDAQLMRLRALCREFNMLEISGEDINSPRQSFRIEKMREPRFSHLIDSTWKLIHHETEETE